MKKILTIIFFFSIITITANAQMRLGDIPPPPQGCLVGGKMYTSYVGVSIEYSYTWTNTYVNNYRYIFRSTTVESCYSNPTVFYGPSPSGYGSAAIGCYLSSYVPSYGSTTHNDSYNFITACPIDTNTYLLLLFVGGISILTIRNKKLSLS
jgi:hypothetical protein